MMNVWQEATNLEDNAEWIRCFSRREGSDEAHLHLVP